MKKQSSSEKREKQRQYAQILNEAKAFSDLNKKKLLNEKGLSPQQLQLKITI